jgi:hypothetical protein
MHAPELVPGYHVEPFLDPLVRPDANWLKVSLFVFFFEVLRVKQMPHKPQG